MMAARSGDGGRNSRCSGQGVPFAGWVGASWRERSDGRMASQWQTAAVRLGVKGLAIVPGRD